MSFYYFFCTITILLLLSLVFPGNNQDYYVIVLYISALSSNKLLQLLRQYSRFRFIRNITDYVWIMRKLMGLSECYPELCLRCFYFVFSF